MHALGIVAAVGDVGLRLVAERVVENPRGAARVVGGIAGGVAGLIGLARLYNYLNPQVLEEPQEPPTLCERVTAYAEENTCKVITAAITAIAVPAMATAAYMYS